MSGFIAQQLPVPEALAHMAAATANKATAVVIRPDSSWRLAEQGFFAALGWMPGTTIAFTPATPGLHLTVVGPEAAGATARVDLRNRLMLPKVTREALAIQAGQPLFLIGNPADGSAQLTTIAQIAHTLREAA